MVRIYVSAVIDAPVEKVWNPLTSKVCPNGIRSSATAIRRTAGPVMPSARK